MQPKIYKCKVRFIDADMLLMVEKGIRSRICDRYANSNIYIWKIMIKIENPCILSMEI